jgi:hypothetical protein
VATRSADDAVSSSLQRPLMTKTRGGQNYITLDDVRDACIELLKQGRKVGPFNVRLELGNRGSYTTINKHLEALGFTTRAARRRAGD